MRSQGPEKLHGPGHPYSFRRETFHSGHVSWGTSENRDFLVLDAAICPTNIEVGRPLLVEKHRLARVHFRHDAWLEVGCLLALKGTLICIAKVRIRCKKCSAYDVLWGIIEGVDLGLYTSIYTNWLFTIPLVSGGHPPSKGIKRRVKSLVFSPARVEIEENPIDSQALPSRRPVASAKGFWTPMEGFLKSPLPRSVWRLESIQFHCVRIKPLPRICLSSSSPYQNTRKLMSPKAVRGY